jgi:serine/threonine protein phosphatase PrpC
MSNQQFTSFSDRDIGQRERLEDYAADQYLETPGGLKLHLAMVADGVGGELDGERASRLAVETILNYFMTSTETEIPRMIVEAIRAANNAILRDLNGMAKTTIALIVIDTQDGDHGRAYVGHVGDSVIYVVRDERLIRLNTDHTVANEKVLRGEILTHEAPFIDRGTALTRALGINENIRVDIGIYARRGTDLVPPDLAHQQGLAGLSLKQGDTLFASSDGLFDANPNDNNDTYLKEDEIIKHAMDRDVEKATRILMSYGNSRVPSDNISMSMVFVPSPKRSNTVGGLSRGLLYGVLGGTVAVIGVLVIVFGSILTGVNEDAAATQAAAAATNDFLGTVIAVTTTPLPTLPPTASPTLRPTATPLPTTTPRPTAASGREVGVAYGAGQPIQAIEEDQRFTNTTGQDIFVALEGNRDGSGQQANMFLANNAGFVIDDIERSTGRQSIDMEVLSGSNMFVELGDFAIGGLNVEISDNSNIRLQTRGACMALQVEANVATVSCYSDGGDDCYYEIPNSPGQISANSRVSFNIPDATLAESALIGYAETISYYELIQRQNLQAPSCIMAIIDQDNDTFPDQDTDTCPGNPGQVEGCPDQDGDGVPESRDECPTVPGSGPDGCPVDSDDDGITNGLDQCPFEFGEQQNRGCPLDSDRDGIPNRFDDCAFDFGTLENGCPVPTAAPQRGSR